MAKSLEQAVQQHKRVFLALSDGEVLDFVGDKFDKWRAIPSVNALLRKDFVIRKIDVERTIGGWDLRTRLWPKDKSVPWFCVLEADGTVLANSVNADDVNIGFPQEDDDISSFATMLTKVRRDLTLEDIHKLQLLLVDFREDHSRKG